MLAYSPFRDIAVGIAAMVGEPTDTTAFGRVDELFPRVSGELAVEKHNTHLVLLQHHKVEMPDALVGVVSHTLLERSRVNYISNVLVDEGVSEMCVSQKIAKRYKKRTSVYPPRHEAQIPSSP
jgi:hypothetical protein